MLRLQRGDTIIEVLLAITVFSLVSVLAMQIMQQGTNTAQRAVEITLVREEIDSQAEALRAAHAQYATAVSNGSNTGHLAWAKIAGRVKSSPTALSYDQPTCPRPGAPTASIPANAFALDTTLHRSAAVMDASNWYAAAGSGSGPPYARQVANVVSGSVRSYGIWIESRYSAALTPGTPGLYTFRIRSCWDDPGQSAPLTLETTVRLYEA